MESIARHRGARLRYLVGAREQVGDPFTARTLAKLVPGLEQHDVFLCGPEAMTESAADALRKAGVPRRHIHRDSFAL